jgi:hypothetical protein
MCKATARHFLSWKYLMLDSGHSTLYFWNPARMVFEFYKFSVCIYVCVCAHARSSLYFIQCLISRSIVTNAWHISDCRCTRGLPDTEGCC